MDGADLQSKDGEETLGWTSLKRSSAEVPSRISEPLDGLLGRVGFLIRRADQAATAAFAEIGDGVTRTQYGALFVLARRDGIDQKTLADLMHADTTTIGLVVQLLEKKGYIVRSPSEQDRRKRVVSLTPAGREALESLEALAARAQERLLGRLSASERETLRRLLTKVVG